VKHEVEVANEVEVKLNQTKLNWTVTQLKSVFLVLVVVVLLI